MGLVAGTEEEEGERLRGGKPSLLGGKEGIFRYT